MKNQKGTVLGLVLIVLCSCSALAQGTYNFTQFYFNPALLNPSYTGIDGRMAVYASYRKQWAGVEGSPTIANFSLQTATAKQASFGVNISNDKNGLISTSGLMFTGGYTVPVSKANFLRFALSIGGAWNKVDINSLKFTTPGDPVQSTLLASNFTLTGNVGVSFHTPTFHAGLAIPNIFEPSYVSAESFSVSKVSPFSSVILHASNRFYFANDKHIFEPYLIYRYNNGLPSQLEAAAVVHLQNVVWVGGSYKQDFGISALVGFKTKSLTALGYSYTLKNSGANQISAPSHEVHLGLIIGKRQKKVPVYSFVDSEKEKVKKTPAQLAAEKKKAAEAAAAAAAEKKKATEAAAASAAAKKTAAELTVAERKAHDEELAGKKEEARQRQEAAAAAALAKGKPEPVKSAALAGQAKLDSAHQAEQAHLARLTEHAEDPTAEHGLENDAHPHAERHEFVKRGNHIDEMDIGDFIIVGAFKSKENAKHYSDGLEKLGFELSDFGYLTERQIWYVFLGETDDLDMARTERDKYRKMKLFKDCWLLTVHH